MKTIIKKSWIIFSIAVLTALVISCILFAPSINAWFVLDDYKWLEKVSPGTLISFFHGSWGHGVAYRPVMRVSFFSDLLLFGENPLGWHLHSYLIHAFNAIFLLVIVQLLSRNWTLAGLTSVFFIVSPLGYENVVWISARVNSLGSFFYLSAFCCFLIYFLPGARQELEIKSFNHNEKRISENSRNGKRHPKGFLVASFILFTIGLMTYEAVVSFPLLLGLVMISHGKCTDLKLRHLLLLLALFGGWQAGFLVFRYHALGKSIGGVAGHSPDYFIGLIHNISTVYALFKSHFQKDTIIVPLLILTLIFLFLKQKWTSVKNIIFILSALAILYLPFSMVEGVAIRFFYMVQIPYLLLIAGALMFWLKSDKILIKAFTGFVVFVIILANIKLSYSQAGDWKKAGEIAKSIPEQVKKMYPQNLSGVDFAFYNIPDTYQSAGVFISYFDSAVKRMYNRFDGNVYKNLYLIPENGNQVKYFNYDATQNRVVELSREEVEKLYLDREIIEKKVAEMAEPKSEGTPWCEPGNIVFGEQNLRIDIGEKSHAKRLEASLAGSGIYKMIFFSGELPAGEILVETKNRSGGGLHLFTIDVPEKIYKQGYSRILIFPVTGNVFYSIGHLILLET
ncbi:MAG: hypothetical protein R6X10_18845 [Desulfobacterales bacterium]